MNMITALQRTEAKPLVAPHPRAERFRRLVALCDRDEIEDAVEALIAYLDTLNRAEDDFVQHAADSVGCPIADPDGEHDGREPELYDAEAALEDAEPDDPTARRPHRDRIRRQICRPIYYKNPWDGSRRVDRYEFLTEPDVTAMRPYL